MVASYVLEILLTGIAGVFIGMTLLYASIKMTTLTAKSVIGKKEKK